MERDELDDMGAGIREFNEEELDNDYPEEQ
jgi:hypothetical protein